LKEIGKLRRYISGRTIMKSRLKGDAQTEREEEVIKSSVRKEERQARDTRG